MKRSICAAFVSCYALVPMSLSTLETGGMPFTDGHSSPALLSFANLFNANSSEPIQAAAAPVEAERNLAQKRNSEMRVKMAKSALMTAKKMHSNGWCYKGVTDALKPLGVELGGPAAYMAKDLLEKDPRFTPVRAEDPTQLHQGDVIVHGPTGAHPYGHIAVYLGNNHEASDHVQKVVLNAIGPYSYSVVFRYDETVMDLDAATVLSQLEEGADVSANAMDAADASSNTDTDAGTATDAIISAAADA